MAFCKKCGSEISDGSDFCKNCSLKQDNMQNEKNSETGQIDIAAKLHELNDTADITDEFDANDIEANKIMAVLAYIGILVLIPILVAPKSKFARFHSNQGLVLLIVNIIYNIITAVIQSIIPALSLVFKIISIIFFVLMIIGIINAVGGKAKELPVIGRILLIK